jgi:dTDP-glucose 4,6-dehydratase/UDP-glucose 4-epimerase
MKLIVIGSKGFIGSYLVNALTVHKGNEVWECDVVTDYVNPRYFLLDATNSDFKSIFREEKFDACINCSGAASVPASIVDPQRDFVLNAANVYKLIDAIRALNPECKLINLSSAAVYGSPDKLPVSEKTELRPISPYGIHKKMAEDICREFRQIYGVRSCSLRLFSAYGDGLKKQLFWDVFQKSRGKDKIELYGTGNESRDFVHVRDICKLIAIVLRQDQYYDASPINVGSGKEYTIREVVELFLNSMGWEGEINFIGQPRKGDPNNWCADISRSLSMGYKPEVSMKDGLLQYANWVKSL